MSKHVSKVSGWVLGVLTAGALVFGLSVAMATPASALTCPNNGWDTLGSKPTQSS